MSSKVPKVPKVIVICHNETQVNEMAARHLGSAHGGEQGRGRSTGEHGGQQGHGRSTGEHQTMTSKKRTWDAAIGRRDYVATSVGGAMQIALNHVVVWTGRWLGVGEYEEQQNAIPRAELAKVLERLRVGDAYLEDQHPRAPAPPRVPDEGSARTLKKAKAPTSKEPKRAKPRKGKGAWRVEVSLKGVEDNPISTYPFDTKGEADAFAKTKRAELAQHPGSLVVAVKGGKVGDKLKEAAAPKAPAETPVEATPKKKPGRPKKVETKTPVEVTPKKKPGRPKKAETTAAATASDKPASPKPVKAPRKPRVAASTTAASGPPTTRSRKSAQVTPEAMRLRLAETNPESPANVLDMFEDIWRGGASEPVQAWMMANKIEDTAAAFVDWVNHHDKQAHAFLQAGQAQRAA
jgi:hypothetical protein